MEKILSNSHTQLQYKIKKLANPKKAVILQRFFKTGPGEYGEGDKFLGLGVPQCRALAQKYQKLSFVDVSKLLQSLFHEERLIALLILVHNFQTGDNNARQKIYNFYLKNTKYINNWDLVDLSADKIVGAYLLNKNSTILFKLARSKNLWERRIAIISTWQFIKNDKFDLTIKLSRPLLKDEHDLMHKAVGWMLREVGKRDKKTLINFLHRYHTQMPRTALRYAIERFSETERRAWLTTKL